MLVLRRLFVTLVLLAAVALAGFYVLTDPRVVSPSPEVGALPAADIENGKVLFNVGGCASCHATPGPPSRWTQPQPVVTISVWPSGWVCQAVRAPGSKVTSAVAMRAGSGGLNSGSMRTVPLK